MRNFPWLSILLLLLANIAFGLFLRDLEASKYIYVWIAAVFYTVLECSVLSIWWEPFHRMILRAFRSDIGYTLAALFMASFAVVIVVWINISSHFFVMLAAALLLRVDLFTRRIGTLLSFIVLLSISWVGLVLSWFVPNFYPL
ncbi:MAG: hypothetical protein AAFQ63_14795 [Cyanobacteria bacterium J06621_11]